MKLDSKIIFDAEGSPIAHAVFWVLRWDNPIFFTTDYYAHDLYLLKEGEGVFIDHGDLYLIESSLPLVQEYRYEDGGDYVRIGWATYRPGEIQAGITYTVVIQAGPQNATLDPFAEDIETYGIRLPPRCIANCLWIPTTWCSIALGDQTLILYNNPHPAGIHPLGGQPLGTCGTPFFLPLIIQ